jgi:UDP-N-acetylglucosamine 3-dehydrogenase
MSFLGTGPLRAAVIGVGAMGRNHARICDEMDGVALVGVVDRDPVVRSQVAARCHTRSFADYESLLEAEDIDFAVVAVPTQEHFPTASALIEHGVHVLVEKPLAPGTEAGCALIEQARARGVKLGVGHVERFNPAVMALKERLDKGELGRIFQISVQRISGFPPRVEDVGVVLDLATHDLDVMRHLTGAEVTRVSAEISRELDRPLEDMLCGLLRFDNGVIGQLNVNWLSPTKIRELAVTGERGMFVVNYLTQDLYFYENSFQDGDWESLQVFRGVAEGRMIRYPINRREPLQVELESFVRAVVDNEPFPVSGEDGLWAVTLAQHLVEAGLQGTSVCPKDTCIERLVPG